MTQRTQEQRIHNDRPAELRTLLYQEERRDVPEITPREQGDLWCIAEAEEGDCGGGQQESLFGNCHRGDLLTTDARNNTDRKLHEGED
jgi:hypothetical protein